VLSATGMTVLLGYNTTLKDKQYFLKIFLYQTCHFEDPDKFQSFNKSLHKKLCAFACPDTKSPKLVSTVNYSQ